MVSHHPCIGNHVFYVDSYGKSIGNHVFYMVSYGPGLGNHVFYMVSYGPGLDLEPLRPKKASKQPPGGLQEPLLSLGPERLQNYLLEASRSHFWAWGQKGFPD